MLDPLFGRRDHWKSARYGASLGRMQDLVESNMVIFPWKFYSSDGLGLGTEQLSDIQYPLKVLDLERVCNRPYISHVRMTPTYTRLVDIILF